MSGPGKGGERVCLGCGIGWGENRLFCWYPPIARTSSKKLALDILRKLRIMRKMAKQTPHEELTTKQVAEALKLSHDTIIRMIKSGKISARRKNPLGGRTSAFLIPASEIERIKKLSQAVK
ncbi:MAG: helix-turn-helix domain-containing protein [Chloroflexi bacterium]|nr:helix-turn-helix domain-containing protein [Chloroflexota bacterium]